MRNGNAQRQCATATRNGNAQVATAAADGTVYMAIGGGVMSSGASARARTRADMLESDVSQLQSAVEEQFANFIPHLRQRGYKDEPVIQTTLTDITSRDFRLNSLSSK